MKELDWDQPLALEGGGELRTTGPAEAELLVLLVGGGTGADRPGKWSTSMTWLAPHVRRAVGPDVRIGQVRYGTSSWNQLHRSRADVRSALDLEASRPRPAGRVALVGLSMGGATTLANVDRPEVVALIAIAPWFPDATALRGLAGKRLLVLHGSLDNALPLVPGTSRRASRAAVETATRLGADAEWRDVRYGLHGTAVRWRGRVWRLPRAGAYARHVRQELARLVAAEAAPVSGRRPAR